MITLSAYRWVPPFAQGWVKDLRIRWALEEAGLAYQVELIDVTKPRAAEYLRWQPFGQVPAYRDETVELFESGAILLHLANRSAALAPEDAAGRAKVASWVIAALNSVEPFSRNFIELTDAPADAAWAAERRPAVEGILARRLDSLAAWLADRDYLEHRFTAGDILMATVLRELLDSGILARYAVLDTYLQRCLARPAFGRALEAQLAVFRENTPA